MIEERPAMDDGLPFRRADPEVRNGASPRSLDRYIYDILPLRLSEASPKLTGRRKGFVWLYIAGTLPIRYLFALVGLLLGLISQFSTYSYIGLYLVIFGGTYVPMKRQSLRCWGIRIWKWKWTRKHYTLHCMLGLVLGIVQFVFDMPWYYIIFIVLIVGLVKQFRRWKYMRHRRREVNSRLDAMTGYNSS